MGAQDDFDALLPFVFEHASVRAALIRLSRTSREILACHPYPAPLARALTETVAASALLASTLKLNGSLVVQLSGDGPVRLSLRLGNQWYPHMKLVVEQAPDGQTSLFRADTHDRHIQVDPSSKDYAAFCELSQKNQSLAGRIEAIWESNALPTFKSFLRNDLARRRSSQS